MVPRLRSLCLEKVNNNIDEVDYQTIPKELARDLQLSKLFNGNFVYDDTFGLHQFGLDACALNIFYDGETWTFTYRSENNELYWYPAVNSLSVAATGLKKFYKVHPLGQSGHHIAQHN